MLGRRSIPLLSLAALALLPACFSSGEGPSPPAEALYFPVGLAVSPGGHTLYVANSDFDLQFNGGTVIGLDLDRLRRLVPPVWQSAVPTDACGPLGVNSQRLLYPGSCGAISLNAPPDGQGTLVTAEVEIGAFATDILALARPDAPGARLFVPVRGDPSLTWMDIDDDRTAAGPFGRKLFCGQSAESPRCDETHRAGRDPDTNSRGAVLPPEPYGIAATASGDALIITHQTTGTASLVTNPWDGLPALQFVLSGLPYGTLDVAALPVPKYLTAASIPYQPGFLTTFRAAAEVDLLRYYDDQAAAPARPFLTRSGAAAITVNSSGVDSRGIAIDSSERQACEEACGQDLACLQQCTDIPARVFIANRTPPSLLIGETRSSVSPGGSDDLVTIYDSVPLSYGASDVKIGAVVDGQGQKQLRVFVSCFDARFIFIYDPQGHRIESQIRTGRGPHGLALDPVEPYLYVAHFTDSYIGVIDLDQRHAASYATVVASVGTPMPPRESK